MPNSLKKKNIRVTVRLPLKLEKDLMVRVISDGYGMKGKSKWVEEAIIHLMGLDDFEDYVEYAEDMVDIGVNKLQSFYLEENLVKLLKDSVIKVRKKHLHLDGVRSLIIRASIIQRLFRGGGQH